MPEISIIIVNYKSWSVLEKCIESISSQNIRNNEIIIVDNNSNDNTVKDFKIKYNKYKWIINNKNLGFSKACNLGAKAAKYEHYIFLNPDTELGINCLIQLKSKIINYPNSIISISQLDSSGNITFPYGKFLSIKTFNGIIRFMFRFLKFESRLKDHKKPLLRPDWVSGSFLSIDKKNFNKLGGWDEDYWMYYEDMDLCKRARNIGMEIILINSISCTHYHGKSSRINLKTTVKTKTHLIKSGIIFIDKHYSGLSQKILKFLFISSRVTEYLLMSPFSKLKRLLLYNLIFNFRVKEFKL
ncbi:MAG: hypothetical protein CBD72_04465 [Flavobacteriaceae bacterium TMED212]|nr:MAG: hypothetical protein CBD72_04465 [Flavobacteriaceae bacterium TMED212]|tara:strand:- start:233 stop:1129 length:897 start_codon:yes stop_codon:yes gene_type:complete